MFEQASGGSPSVAGARNFSVPQVSAERRGDIASQGAPAPKRAGGFMQNRPPSFLETLKRVKENDPSLTVVDMSNSAAMQCKVSEYTTQLTDALKSNTQVKEVRLENCGIGDRECETLAEVLKANSVITFIDLQKNCVNNDGATALARGLAANTSVVEVNLMSQQKSRWGDNCLEEFIAMFASNITLLKITLRLESRKSCALTKLSKITWRLESRKSFALTKLITRNNDIDRRKKNNMPYLDILPTAFKASYQGPPPAEGVEGNKENVAASAASAHQPAAAAAAVAGPPSPPARAATNGTNGSAGTPEHPITGLALQDDTAASSPPPAPTDSFTSIPGEDPAAPPPAAPPAVAAVAGTARTAPGWRNHIALRSGAGAPPGRLQGGGTTWPPGGVLQSGGNNTPAG
ncbi:hypothetical protein T484DRAFT_1766671 [Baffinella frigidus]|nr:hypothetical protein T484DRAFT_1766671 [Cryptophyta sp. CCMP2293]